MRSHVTGSSNTAVGNSAMGLTGTSGSSNTAVGSNALLVTNADGNTAVGRNAGNTNTTGTNNTLIGFDADVTATGLTNATAIGYNATVAQSNSLVLGQTGTDVGIGTTTPDSTFSVADNFLVGSSGTIQYDNSVPVMSYMFKSGSSNADRMVIAHSPGFPTYGLQYEDASDQFNFLGGGTNRLAIELNTGQVGIGVANPSRLLDVNGNFRLGVNGTTVTNIIKVTINQNIASVPANSTVGELFTVANAALGSTVYISPAVALANGLLIAYARVSAAGTVEVGFTNTTAGAINMTAMDYYITVIQ
ncbi:MAG: hypothetical protein IPL84_03640 [Chitinophagaceae bacterium]|nr:hypothetical protein [Chitinophagaceae bacterium]